jgi:hypothetical protein
VILFAVTVPSLKAQNNQFGAIKGTVIDPSGAPIPGATVTLASPALVVPQTIASDSSGNYHFEQLPTGAYKVTASATGFQQYARENIQITAGFSADDRWIANRGRNRIGREPGGGHHVHHYLHQRRRQNRGR